MGSWITVVTGLPRSGTTLMMRMLEAGGLPLYYDDNLPFEFKIDNVVHTNHNVILRETDKIKTLQTGDGSWLNDCYGKAVKILTPTKITPPKGHRYKFIYMDRKIKHMAKSQAKYAVKSKQLTPPPKMALHQHINEVRGKSIAMLKNYPKSDFILIRFEDILKNPKGASFRVVQFLNMNLNIDKMISVVFKRPVQCLDDMVEEKIYNN